MKAYHWRSIIEDRARIARLAKNAPAPGAPDVKVTLPPRNEPPPAVVVATPGPAPAPVPRAPYITFLPATTPGRNICIECKHYEYRSCTNPRARHPVSGEYVDAHAARKNRESCGAHGRYWDARPARQRVVRVDDGSEPMEYVPPVPVRRLDVIFKDEVVAVLWDATQTRCGTQPEDVAGGWTRIAEKSVGDAGNGAESETPVQTGATANEAGVVGQSVGIQSHHPTPFKKYRKPAPGFTAMQLALAAIAHEANPLS